MCTILLRFDPQAATPIVVAANRDEFRDRPADDPHDAGGALFAGRDRRAGGTWLAVGRGGLAAVTNLGGTPRRADARTRGELPLAVLSGALPDTFAEWNPFNLLVATPRRVEVVTHAEVGAPPQRVELPPGDHVVVNEPFGTTGTRRRVDEERLRRVGPVFAALAGHADEPDQAICRHGDVYGTVCATIVALDARGGVERYHYRRGTACALPTFDLTAAARASTEAGPRGPVPELE